MEKKLTFKCLNSSRCSTKAIQLVKVNKVVVIHIIVILFIFVILCICIQEKSHICANIKKYNKLRKQFLKNLCISNTQVIFFIIVFNILLWIYWPIALRYFYKSHLFHTWETLIGVQLFSWKRTSWFEKPVQNV